MKKKIFLRSAVGFPIGVTIGYFITIILSFAYGNGYYSPCVPELVDKMGNEVNAVLLQTLLCGILGIGFAGSSFIWEIEHWGITKQTGIYFLVISVLMMPAAYFNYWMEHSIKGFFSYFGIFFFIFVIIWIVEFIISKRNVRELNNYLDKAKDSKRK